MQTALQLLSMWLKERMIQNQSEHTITAYQRDLTDFFKFCENKQLQLHDVEASDLREYLAERVECDQLSSSKRRYCPLVVHQPGAKLRELRGNTHHSKSVLTPR